MRIGRPFLLCTVWLYEECASCISSLCRRFCGSLVCLPTEKHQKKTNLLFPKNFIDNLNLIQPSITMILWDTLRSTSLQRIIPSPTILTPVFKRSPYIKTRPKNISSRPLLFRSGVPLKYSLPPNIHGL